MEKQIEIKNRIAVCKEALEKNPGLKWEDVRNAEAAMYRAFMSRDGRGQEATA